tara:strand:- start:323 stop:1570 length:1248 start_codon:yes stop_codon:yes gene_type:complete
MQRADFFNSYKFNWETFDIIASGKSSLDAKNYISSFKKKENAQRFLDGYGFDTTDPVQNAELFGNFQEAIQFIKRYFLIEGNPEGLDATLPNIFYSITDVSDLLLIATGNSEVKTSVEDAIWAGVILKVMHTILHTDKDLRYRYFSTIQTQVFDRFYKYINRDEDDNLFLFNEETNIKIPLVEFETKSKKTRESTIIKLLHKKENVAEELFDRIGIRLVTKSKVDVLRVINFLIDNYLVIPNNIKPSRSQNSLIDLNQFKNGYYKILKNSIKNNLSEEEFCKDLEELASESHFEDVNYTNNKHTSNEYKAVHFTCRQLIKYRNPFMQKFNEIKKIARSVEGDSDLAESILGLDTSSIAKDVRFFYPFEVQITDLQSHNQNTEGEASHHEYKKQQLKSAMKRLFKNLIEYHNIKID